MVAAIDVVALSDLRVGNDFCDKQLRIAALFHHLQKPLLKIHVKKFRRRILTESRYYVMVKHTYI
jgi:hypothetical protein